MTSYQVSIEQVPQRPTAVVRATVPHDGVGPFIGKAFGEVMQAMGAQHVHPAGEPFAQYRIAGDGSFEIAAGFPVSEPIVAMGEVVPMDLPAGTVAQTMHVGAYDEVNAAYEALVAWINAEGYQVAGDPWESYLDGPEVAKPRTVIRMPCRRAG